VQSFNGFLHDIDRMSRSIADDLTEPLELCKEPISEGISRAFDTATSPEGQAWPPRVFDAPHPLLQESGELRAAATGQGSAHIERIEGGTELLWGVDKQSGGGGVPGAAVHQFGATIHPVEKQFLRFEIGDKVIFATEVTIPARPYLGFSEETVGACEDIFGDWLQEQAAEEVAA
jgi:phage gpG-like protein